MCGTTKMAKDIHGVPEEIQTQALLLDHRIARYHDRRVEKYVVMNLTTHLYYAHAKPQADKPEHYLIRYDSPQAALDAIIERFTLKGNSNGR